jgi:hypothetical protein
MPPLPTLRERSMSNITSPGGGSTGGPCDRHKPTAITSAARELPVARRPARAAVIWPGHAPACSRKA